MSATAMIMACLVILPAAALVAWSWFVMGEVEEEWRSLGRFEGLHVEMRPEAAQTS